MRHVVLIALALAACKPKTCDSTVKPELELRDGSGALTLAYKAGKLCDSHNRIVGAVEKRADGVTLADAGGSLRLSLTRESDQAAAGRDRSGPHLRLYRDAKELRVLDAAGVPLGSIVPEGIAATIFNPARVPIAKVEMRDRDAVVTDLGGGALDYVVPAREPGPAGVFGVPRLEPVEAMAIYIFWSR